MDVSTPSPPSTSGSRPAPSVRRLLVSPVVAPLLLFATYLALSLLVSGHGYLSTDTGGKVVTLEVMRQTGEIDPDIGYWAAEWDPEADHHPLYYTSEVDGSYVNVTSLPMVVVALPLYEVGGYRAALAVVAAGAVAAALAARALARRCGGDGWLAFWVVGLASPVTVYALDLWEHAPGVGLLAWAAVVLVDLARGDRRWWWGGVAGLLFGAAATMRTEALAYGAVQVAVVGVLLLVRRRQVLAVVGMGVAAVVGLAVPLVLNAWLESTVGGMARAGRAGGAAANGLASLGVRAREALVTTVGIEASDEPQAIVIGLATVGLLAGLAVAARRRAPQRQLVLLATGVLLLYLIRGAPGPGFVPGALVAAPLAVVGLSLGWRRPATHEVLALALLPLPVVWAFQYTGGAVPQWGGRYVLTTGLLLTVAGIASLPDIPQLWVRRAWIGLAVAVTAFGAGWEIERSHQIATAGEAIAARSEDVVVSEEAFWFRELGDRSVGRSWLTANGRADLPSAVAVAEQSGATTLAVVDVVTGPDDGPAELDGWSRVDEVRATWLDVPFRVTSYRRGD